MQKQQLRPEEEARLDELPEELRVRVLEKILNKLQQKETKQPSTKTLEKKSPTKEEKES